MGIRVGLEVARGGPGAVAELVGRSGSPAGTGGKGEPRVEVELDGYVI